MGVSCVYARAFSTDYLSFYFGIFVALFMPCGRME